MRRSALVLLLVSHVASAQSNDVTKVFQTGVDAFRLGKFDEARKHLEKARDLDPKLPGPHRFLAAVDQAQARFPECMKSAFKALELNPRSSEAPDTRKLYEACRVSAGRSPAREDLGDSAAIAITTDEPGATVKINGLTYGGTPLFPRPITAGPLEIEIEKAGYKTYKAQINALAGIVTDLDIALERDLSVQVPTDLEVKAADIKVGYLIVPTQDGTLRINDKPVALTGQRIELDPGTHVVELQQPGKDPWRRRVRISAGQKTMLSPMFVDTGARASTERTGFYILGAGSAVLAGGFVAAMMSRSAADEARDIVRVERSRDPSRPVSETESIAAVRTRDDLQDARDRHARMAVISNALYVTGLVTAGVGAYFIYRGARERRDAPPPFAIAPVNGGAIVAKELSW
jgi:hypothetical protein